MEANEFRIGNYVNIFNQIPIKITANHILAIQNGDNSYTPINVSIKWLLDFGFYKDSKIFDTYSKKINGNEFKIIISNDGKFYFYFHITNKFSLEIKYIHELQNLFFALMKVELELKQNEK